MLSGITLARILGDKERAAVIHVMSVHVNELLLTVKS